MIRFASSVASVLAFSLLAACAATSAEPVGSAAAEVGSCKEVDEHQVEHACLHSFAGPFRNVTASTTAPPDVSREHTAYRVTLAAIAPSANASDAGSHAEAGSDVDAAAPAAPAFGGAVSFLPEEDGEYAIYTSDPTMQLTAVDGHGKEAKFECTTEVPEDLCSGLRQLRVGAFEHGVPVTLSLGSNAAGVLLLIEHMGDHEHGHTH